MIQSTGGRSWGYNGWSTEITNTTALTAGDLTGYTFADPTGAADANKRTVDNLKQIVDKNADTIFAGINSANNGFLGDMVKLEAVREDAILKRIPVLNSVINFIRSEAFLLPPTGAVAGIYARVDNNRGVWKAPANESIINVVAPSVLLTHDQHGELNIDPSTGKSINVIRSFVGKGNLVWGARTLAGNDNEWRYVNVRRLFNMIEESSKKATEQFVFESNDANTWVKVQAMIENFLTTLWRQGAFFGATPDKAFYVLVGLNKTMTQLDILEGRMIVEVGVAANRPAEFIILRFSHKLPEA
ncbi:phage tail sheath family protein [Pseudarcicella hirudinis]|uniref:phage tail sheath family protein n=1 Tax=Pseudarcicella hirudinis TaxID=1079859 RepID=UPI0035E527F7